MQFQSYWISHHPFVNNFNELLSIFFCVLFIIGSFVCETMLFISIMVNNKCQLSYLTVGIAFSVSPKSFCESLIHTAHTHTHAELHQHVGVWVPCNWRSSVNSWGLDYYSEIQLAKYRFSMLTAYSLKFERL